MVPFDSLILSPVCTHQHFSQPELKPLVEKDIPKVVRAIRQTQSKKVLSKLLTRIKVRCAIDVSTSAHQLT